MLDSIDDKLEKKSREIEIGNNDTNQTNLQIYKQKSIF